MCYHPIASRTIPIRIPVKDITFGSSAGTVPKVFVHPFDLKKHDRNLKSSIPPPDLMDQEIVFLNHGKMKASEVFTAGSFISRPLPGPVAIRMSVIHTEGLRGLWLGQTGTLIRECGGGAAWFMRNLHSSKVLRPDLVGYFTIAVRLPLLSFRSPFAN
ncbi:hypothetical protein C8R48DRAFT_771464 [Suillus tomentosus]|nr:hypothetical protein C8R48DRAFT_771464 [Suillus tomentosus]